MLVVDRLIRKERTGIERYYDQIISLIPRLRPKWNFTIVSFGESQQIIESEYNNVVHCPVPISRRKLNLRNILSLPQNMLDFISGDEIDLIHMLKPLPLKVGQIPTIVTVYDLAPFVLRSNYSRWVQLATWKSMKMLAEQQTKFVCISKNTQRDLNKYLSVDMNRSYVTYLGVTENYQPVSNAEVLNRVRGNYGLPHDFLLYIGSLHPRKNLKTIVKAYHQYLENKPDNPIALVIAGRYDLGKLSLSGEYKRTLDKLIMPGYIEEVDLPAIISAATALLYPSIYEGFGLPVIEAMACGTPVITSNSSSINELVTDYTITCDPYDIDCFTRVIESLRTANDLAIQVAANQEHAAQFTWQRTAENTLAYYERILKESTSHTKGQ